MAEPLRKVLHVVAISRCPVRTIQVSESHSVRVALQRDQAAREICQVDGTQFGDLLLRLLHLSDARWLYSVLQRTRG